MVRFGDVLSDELSCGYGVPQGGVISAVNFIIYIIDLVKCANEVEFAIYADDTNLFTTGDCMKQNIENINRGLALIHKWMLANKLTLNINKSKFMMFKQRLRCLPNDIVVIRIDQTYLERVDHIKFLGVILDEGLTWNHQVSAVTCRISKFVPILYSTSNNFDASLVKLIYLTLIYPTIIYCNSVWRNYCRKQSTSLELALKKSCVSFRLAFI